MMLTGRGKAWMRHQPAGGGEGTAVRRALWWPPTKIAGRYLSPYLAARHGTDAVGEGPRTGWPAGRARPRARRCPRPPTRCDRRASAARPSAPALRSAAPRRGGRRKQPARRVSIIPAHQALVQSAAIVDNRTTQTSYEPHPRLPALPAPEPEGDRCDRYVSDRVRTRTSAACRRAARSRSSDRGSRELT